MKFQGISHVVMFLEVTAHPGLCEVCPSCQRTNCGVT